MSPPGGVPVRVRNAAATRAAILEAARIRFSRESYDHVGLRDIAADAGIDAALISRYFGSKDDLFAEVLSTGDNGGELMIGAVSDFGARAARLLIHEPQTEDKLRGLMIMLRSASSPRAKEMVARSIRERFHEPLSEWIGGEKGDVRARIVGAILCGLAMTRLVTDSYGVDAESQETFEARMAKLLQDAISERG